MDQPPRKAKEEPVGVWGGKFRAEGGVNVPEARGAWLALLRSGRDWDEAGELLGASLQGPGLGSGGVGAPGRQWANGCVPSPGYTGPPPPAVAEPQPWVGRGHWEPRWEVVPLAQPSLAQGHKVETQAGSRKSHHGRAAGLLGLRRESSGMALPQRDRWSQCLLDSQSGCPD